jgi:hypothetical protein
VDVQADRNLFYTFTECTENPDAPLLLWLNGCVGLRAVSSGLRWCTVTVPPDHMLPCATVPRCSGPGCSSLGGGFLSELGPFLPLPGGTKLQVRLHARYGSSPISMPMGQASEMLRQHTPALISLAWFATLG